MKRFVSVLLAAVLLLGMVSCANAEKDWQEQYDFGMRYLSEGNYEEAILAFSAAIDIDGDRPEAYMGRAEAYIAIGEPDKALKDYKKARKVAKADDAYEDLVDELEELIEELEEIIAEENAALDIQPAGPVILLASAEVYSGDTLGYSDVLTYDGYGLLTQVQTTEYTYGYGSTNTYFYDEAGRLVSVTFGEYAFAEYEYDSEGRLIRYFHAEGGATETTYEYDDHGRLAREYSNVDTGNEEILYIYDDRGVRTGAMMNYTDWYGGDLYSGTITYEYDALGRLLVETVDAGLYYTRSEYSYYENAVLRNSQSAEGYGWAQVQFADASGELRWSMYVYDTVVSVEEEEGRITKITDAGGVVYLLNYAAISGETVEETTPNKSLGLYKPLEYEILCVDRSYYDADGILRIQRYFDKVVIAGNRPEFAAMNAAIEADMAGFFSVLDGEDLSYYISYLSGSEYLFHTAEVEVTENSGVVFSYRISTSWYMGGVFNADNYGMSFDVATGEPVYLPTLFGVSEEEMCQMMKDAAWAYLSANHSEALWDSSREAIYGYELDDFIYYFRDGELIITFPTYSISYGAAGSFTVPTGLYY